MREPLRMSLLSPRSHTPRRRDLRDWRTPPILAVVAWLGTLTFNPGPALAEPATSEPAPPPSERVQPEADTLENPTSEASVPPQSPEQLDEASVVSEATDPAGADTPPPDQTAQILAWAPEEQLLVRVLNNGLRVLIARDQSLNVGAVGLSFPSGYADDPVGQEGLTRTLALHLEQGSRELRPGGRIARVHDSGGYTSMAVGAKQTRFESLVPVWALWDIVADLSGVLHHPTSSEIRWRQSVGRATKDRTGVPRIGGQAIASAWSEPALIAASKRAPKALSALTPAKIRAEIDRRFSMQEATLIVISPYELDVVADKIEGLLDSGARRPHVTVAPRLPPSGVDPVAPQQRKRQRRFVLAIEGSISSIWRARVLCGALNRQPKVAGEPPKGKLRCQLHEDPRRPVLQITVAGVSTAEASAFAAGRLTRLAEDPVDRGVLQIERVRQGRNLVDVLHTPLPLLALLSDISTTPPPGSQTRISLSEGLQLPSLLATAELLGLARELANRLRAPTRILDAPPAPSPGTTPSADTAAAATTSDTKDTAPTEAP